jgi:pimeloyl-ACP methyl ester carboxylesterase
MLLHGALGARSQFQPLSALLENECVVHTLDFEGHGTSALKNRPLRFSHFAENILEYLDAHAIERVSIFGHSMGGHVGLYTAAFFPDRVDRVFTLGTKFAWTPESAAKENAFLQPETLQKKVPAFARELMHRHTAAGWEILLENIREMQLHSSSHPAMTDDDMHAIAARVRIGVGDRDQMVTIEESVAAYRRLQKGELQVFPRTPHPIERVPIKLVADAVLDFLAE